MIVASALPIRALLACSDSSFEFSGTSSAAAFIASISKSSWSLCGRLKDFENAVAQPLSSVSVSKPFERDTGQADGPAHAGSHSGVSKDRLNEEARCGATQAHFTACGGRP